MDKIAGKGKKNYISFINQKIKKAKCRKFYSERREWRSHWAKDLVREEVEMKYAAHGLQPLCRILNIEATPIAFNDPYAFLQVNQTFEHSLFSACTHQVLT